MIQNCYLFALRMEVRLVFEEMFNVKQVGLFMDEKEFVENTFNTLAFLIHDDFNP